MELTTIAKYLICFGIIFIFLGSLLYFLSKIGIGIGKLPGDILIQKGNFTFYFPLVSCIVISLILTLVLRVFIKK